jgi:O-antigen ligase
MTSASRTYLSITELVRTGRLMAAAFALSVVAAVLYCSTRLGVDPAVVVASAGALVLALVAMRRWPLVIFAGLQFVGNFKTVPAQGFELRDPTMILLLLCLGALVIHVLFAFANFDRWTLDNLLRGQAAATVLFLLLVASIAISVFYTPNLEQGSGKALRFAVFETLSFFFPILFLKTRKDVRQFVLICVLIGFALSAKVMVTLLHPSQSVLQGDTDITQLGDGMMLSISLLMMLFSVGAFGRTFRTVSIAILSFALVSCAARTPLIGFLVSITITALFATGEIGRISRRTLSFTAIAIVALGIPALMWLETLPATQAKLHYKTAELEAAISGSPFQGGTVERRLDFYRSAGLAMSQHPVIGVGAGGWSIFYSKQDSPRYPHNFVLEVGAEQGLIGLTILLALLALLFRDALRALRSGPAFAFIFPVFVCCVLLNLMTGAIESRTLWFCCGLAAAGSRLSLEASFQYEAQDLDRLAL